jgi:hypothetical protein
VRGEFVEMPGLTLTFPQAERLWGSSMMSAGRSSTRSSVANFSADIRRHDCARRRGEISCGF